MPSAPPNRDAVSLELSANADASLHSFPIVDLVAARALLAMLRKTLAKALRPSATRFFSSSALARRVVATNPVKAQEV